MSDVQPTHTTTTHTTALGRNWLIKTLIFLVLLLGFGTWGLADALYFYPKRGEMDAARNLQKHLVAAGEAGKLSADQLKVTDPVATYRELRGKPASERPDGSFNKTRLDWLESLNRMWALKPEPRLVHTEKAAAGAPAKKYYFDMRSGEGYVIESGKQEKTPVTPRVMLDVLTRVKDTSLNVTPLSGFDMLFQWVFVVIGFGGGLWMLIVLARSAARKYRWQPATQTLTLPDGKSVTPGDLKELDKRLWHKFFVVMHTKDGAAYKLDLLRYQPLEEWVVAMEQTAFPEPDSVSSAAPNPAPAEPPAAPVA